MSEALLAQLHATIAALEAQRGLLGDAIVDTALGPLKTQLAALAAPAPAPSVAASATAAAPASSVSPVQSLRLVTILFLDVVGSTALSQRLDPEEVHAVMDGALQACTVLVHQQAGRVLQYAGDNLS